MGRTRFADGEWIGIKLDAPNGKNDGSVQAVRYFDAKPLHGIFVRRDQLKMISSSPNAQKGGAAYPYQQSNSNNSSNSIVYKISHATFSNDFHYHFPDQAVTGAAFLFSPASPVASLHASDTHAPSIDTTSTSHSNPSNLLQLIENDSDTDQACFSPPQVQEDRAHNSNHDVVTMMADAMNEHADDALGSSSSSSTDFSSSSLSLHATPPYYHQQQHCEVGDNSCDTEHGTPSTVEYSNAYSANTSTIFYSPLLLTTASGKYSLREEEEGAARGQGVSQALNDLAVENHALRDRVLSHHKMLELTLFQINELCCDLQSMKTGRQGRDQHLAATDDVLRLKEQLDVLDRGVQQALLTRANKSKRQTSAGCCPFFCSNS